MVGLIMKLTDEQIAELAERATDKISKILRTKERKTTKQKEGFDISKHEFSDEAIEQIALDGETIYFRYKPDERIAYLSRGDCIALAKHFKITAEDLK